MVGINERIQVGVYLMKGLPYGIPEALEYPTALPIPESEICTFLWVYYGFPASSYEGISVERMRNACGAKMAQRQFGRVDFTAAHLQKMSMSRIKESLHQTIDIINLSHCRQRISESKKSVVQYFFQLNRLR